MTPKPLSAIVRKKKVGSGDRRLPPKRSGQAKKGETIQIRMRLHSDHYTWLEGKVENKCDLRGATLSHLINKCITQSRIDEVKHLNVGPSQLHRFKAYLETQDLEEHKFAGAMLRLLTAFLASEVHLL